MKMKTKFVLLALLMLTAFTQVQAQYNEEKKLTFALKGALNMATLRGNYPYLEDPETRIGFLAGADVDYVVWFDTYGWAGEIYLSSGLNFSTKGAKAKNGKASLYSSYITMPVHVGYKQPFGDIKMKMHGGFYLGHAISAEYKEGDKTYNVMSDDSYFKFRKFEYGIGGGIGLEYKVLDLGLNVDYGLTDLRETDSQLNIQNLNYYFSVGYRF